MADTRDSYPTVTPYLVVADADAELTFLKRAFGAVEKECHRNADNTVVHAEVIIGDSLVMLGQAGGQWKPLGGSLYVWIDDVDATYAKALEAGANRRVRRRTRTTAIEMPGWSTRTASRGGSARR